MNIIDRTDGHLLTLPPPLPPAPPWLSYFLGCHTHSGDNCEVATSPPTCDSNATYSPPALVSAAIDSSFSYIVLQFSGPTNFGGIRSCDGNVTPFFLFSCLFISCFLAFCFFKPFLSVVFIFSLSPPLFQVSWTKPHWSSLEEPGTVLANSPTHPPKSW